MKKMMFALLVAAVSVTAMAQVLIYDYNASFKALSVKKLNVATYKNTLSGQSVKAKIDSPKVASDKFKGYVVIQACTQCSGDMEESTDVENNPAVVYFYRNGGNKKAVYRAVGGIYANMFYEKAGLVELSQGEDVINYNKFNKAAGMLGYKVAFRGEAAGGRIEGYMGYTSDSDFDAESYVGYVFNYGFGTVGKKTLEISYDCEDIEINCWYIKDLSGSMLSVFKYPGICSNFLFDLCDLYQTDVYAPIEGSWSMKLNSSMSFSKNAFNAMDFYDADLQIAAKMGVNGFFGNPDDEGDVDFYYDATQWGSDAE